MSHCPYLLHKFVMNYRLFFLLPFEHLCIEWTTWYITSVQTEAKSLSIILCSLFIRVTDCSIRVSWSFTEGLQSPCPPGCYTYYMIVIIKMIEICNIATQPYYCWWTMHAASIDHRHTPIIYAASKQSYHAPHLRIYRLNRRRFVTSYVQPVMQHWVRINNCNFCSLSSYYGRFNGSHHVPTTKLILTFCGEQRWMVYTQRRAVVI